MKTTIKMIITLPDGSVLSKEVEINANPKTESGISKVLEAMVDLRDSGNLTIRNHYKLSPFDK